MFDLFTLGALASAFIAGPSHPADPETDFIAGPVPSSAWDKDARHAAAPASRRNG